MPSTSFFARRPLVLVVAGAALVAAVAAGAPAARHRTTRVATREEKPAASLEEALAREVDATRRASRAFGVSVVDVADGRPVFAFDADERRILASNTKLLTTAAALDAFGPAQELETKLMARGVVQGPRLEGDLAVFAGADPNLSGRFHNGNGYAIFERWADALKERGVEEVTGGLELVDGLFTGPRVHPDWPRDQLGYWYEAPIDALSFEDNCVLVRVVPGDRPGATAHASTVPPMGYFRVISTAVTASGKGAASLLVRRADDTDTIFVSGSIGQRTGAVDVWVAVLDPPEYFGAALRSTFERKGIRIDGATRVLGDAPAGAWEEIADWKSDLEETLAVTNKHSQNLYAETLTKYLGWKKLGQGSWEKGVQAILDFAARLGIPRDDVFLADGSGLSRRNEATPRAMTTLLERMYAHPYGRDFLRTLPTSGERGLVWRFRLADGPYRGNVLAKTGTINGVSTLSGYARARSGKVYAFSILCNQVRNNSAAHAAQDRIVRALIDRG